MPKHWLSQQDLENLANDQTMDEDVNPRKESERCGCDYCMSEWMEADDYEAPKKDGFKIDEIVVDSE